MARESARKGSSRSGTAGREAAARGSDVVALLVLLGSIRADDRRVRELLRGHVTKRRVQLSRGQAAALDVPQHLALGAEGRDRRLAPEPRERERALGVDLSDAGSVDLGALGEVAQPGGRGPR